MRILLLTNNAATRDTTNYYLTKTGNYYLLPNNDGVFVKKTIKSGIRVFIENDADIFKICIRLSKTQLLRLLDILLPTDDDVVVETTTSK